jgi:hypothetical protein
VTVAPGREHHQPPADHGIDRNEGQYGKSDPGARLGGAIDIASIQEATDQPLPPWFGGLDHGGRPAGHR